MTTDADVEENDPNGHEDEGEHPEDLRNETEDAASASTSTSTSATSTPWSAILVAGGSHSFYYTLYMYFCREQGGHQPLTTSKERFSKS